jgi:hypothetical protein
MLKPVLAAIVALVLDAELPKAREYVRSQLDGAIYAYGEPRRVDDELAARWAPGVALFVTKGDLTREDPTRCKTGALLIAVDVRSGRAFPVERVLALQEHLAKVKNEADARSAALFAAKVFSCHASSCERAYGSFAPADFEARATSDGWTAGGGLRDRMGRDFTFQATFDRDGLLKEYTHTYKPHRHK